MSLTSQLKDKNSQVRYFFEKYQNKKGMKKSLSSLQSTKILTPMFFEPRSLSTYALIGTTADYLLRYTANKNHLDLEETVAKLAFYSFGDIPREDSKKNYNCEYLSDHIKALDKIGESFLDGRDAKESKAIYSATALSLMDNVFRSHILPVIFNSTTKENYKKEENNHTAFLFNQYYELLGGRLYENELAFIINTFQKALNDNRSEIFGINLTVYNKGFANSRLVGGADFDCIIQSQNKSVLTDIKTKINKLSVSDLYQIISYSLLYDEAKDNVKFDSIGIYHSRSGSFRELDTQEIVEECFYGFGSIDEARKTFIDTITTASKK